MPGSWRSVWLFDQDPDDCVRIKKNETGLSMNQKKGGGKGYVCCRSKTGRDATLGFTVSCPHTIFPPGVWLINMPVNDHHFA